MPTFADLEAAAPTIAAFLRDRIERTGLCFVGTTRSDGWPRVSGWELFLHDGRIYVGSMPNAMKVKDLRRDPRCCLITPLADKDDLSGDAKVFCRAREVDSKDEYERARKAFLEVRGFDMGEFGGAHLIELEVEGAAFSRVDGVEEFHVSSWNPTDGLRERVRRGAIGESVELT
jgi:hypothetical protein